MSFEDLKKIIKSMRDSFSGESAFLNEVIGQQHNTVKRKFTIIIQRKRQTFYSFEIKVMYYIFQTKKQGICFINTFCCTG